MVSGYYFICEEDADITHTHVLFYYKAVGGGNAHPLYLTFGEDRIEFFFNGDIKKHLEGKITKEFIETPPLFSLPLAKDKGSIKALQEQLASLYKGKFPIISGNKRSAKKDDYRLLENVERGNFSYKAANILRRFPIISWDYPNLEIDHTEESINILFYRDLILDFLFDLKHKPEVFEASPNFKKVSILIRDSVMIQAIAAKAEFYYQFGFQNKASSTDENDFDLSFETKNGIDEIKNSFSNWISLLQEHEAHTVINEPHKWFEDVETEMTNALRYKEDAISNYGDQILKREINQSAEKHNDSISKWFIERNNILKAWMNNTCFEKGVFWASLIIIIYILGSVFLSIYNKYIIPCEQWNLISNPWIYLIPVCVLICGFIYCLANKIQKNVKLQKLIKLISPNNLKTKRKVQNFNNYE